jgi:hypothetical protein
MLEMQPRFRDVFKFKLSKAILKLDLGIPQYYGYENDFE